MWLRLVRSDTYERFKGKGQEQRSQIKEQDTEEKHNRAWVSSI